MVGRPESHPSAYRWASQRGLYHRQTRLTGRFRPLVLLWVPRWWQARRNLTARAKANTMLSVEKEAHRRRMLEHLAQTAASGQLSAAATQSDPQFSIRLVGEVRRNKAAPQPSRRRRRSVEGTGQSDLRGL
jgi:hypothetical protein